MTDFLLVKPAVWTDDRKVAVLRPLIDQGAVVLAGHSAVDIRREIGAGSHRLIAAGGDGTVHLGLNAIVGTPHELAIVPMGTGNDIARVCGLRNAQMSTGVLKTGQVKRVDVGRIVLADGQERHFLGVASCGFDAQVNERANRLRGPAGTLKYLLAVFIELAGLRALRLQGQVAQLTLDGKYLLLAVGNVHRYGGGMQICPGAKFDDGEFQVVYGDSMSRLRLLALLPTIFWGGHLKSRLVHSAPAAQVSVSGDDFLVYADGERVGSGPATFTCQPSAVSLWMP